MGKCQDKYFFSSNSHVSIKPFEIISSDVLGPSPVIFVEGYKYYISLIDDFTIFTWIFPLIYKSQVHLVFNKFHALIRTQFKIL